MIISLLRNFTPHIQECKDKLLITDNLINFKKSLILNNIGGVGASET